MKLFETLIIYVVGWFIIRDLKYITSKNKLIFFDMPKKVAIRQYVSKHCVHEFMTSTFHAILEFKALPQNDGSVDNVLALFRGTIGRGSMIISYYIILYHIYIIYIINFGEAWQLSGRSRTWPIGGAGGGRGTWVDQLLNVGCMVLWQSPKYIPTHYRVFMMSYCVWYCLIVWSTVSRLDLGTKLFGFPHDNLQPKSIGG